MNDNYQHYSQERHRALKELNKTGRLSTNEEKTTAKIKYLERLIELENGRTK